jgi:hypothetical protein
MSCRVSGSQPGKSDATGFINFADFLYQVHERCQEGASAAAIPILQIMLVAIHKAGAYFSLISDTNFIDCPISKHCMSCKPDIPAKLPVFKNDGEPLGDNHSAWRRTEIVMRDALRAETRKIPTLRLDILPLAHDFCL